MPLWLFYLLNTIFTTRLGPNQHQQCMPVLPAAADAPTQVSSTLTSCCLQMMHLCKLPPVCKRSHCTTRRRHMLKLLASNACREGTAMSNDASCTSRGVPAADTGTRMARTDGCSLKIPGIWLTQAACALSRVHGRRELETHPERDGSDPQDGTPRIRSCLACQTRLQTSQKGRDQTRSSSTSRRQVSGPLSRLSRTGGGITDGRRGDILQLLPM